MKKTFLIIFYFLYASSLSFSQWTIQPLPVASGNSVSIDFSDINVGVTCGGFIDFQIYARASYTSNGGANWRSSTVPDSGRFFNSVKFVSLNQVYMGGTYQPGFQERKNSMEANGSERKAFFLKSSNYGKNWGSSTSPDLNMYSNIEAIDFINPLNGIAIVNNNNLPVGYTDKLLITTNSGINWSSSFTQADSVPVDIVSIQYMTEDLIYAAGNNSDDKSYKGLFMVSSDGGMIWKSTSINDLIVNNISFIDNETGFLLGQSTVNYFSVLFKTVDGGANWDLIQTFTDNYYTGVKFLKGSGIGLLYGFRIFFENPVISLTNDFGSIWRNQQLPVTNDLLLMDAVLLDPYIYNVTGGEAFTSGIILNTTNGGLTFTGNNSEVSISEKYSLHQNYPNPFNPNTVIEFSISEIGPPRRIVSLKIFDIHGKEIATLVNERLSPGSYKVKWNGEGFSSGVYYYKLETNAFSDTKKMFLIK